MDIRVIKFELAVRTLRECAQAGFFGSAEVHFKDGVVQSVCPKPIIRIRYGEEKK